MKISRLLSLLAILAFSVSSARADFIVTLLQVGPNVVATGTGAINLTGLSFNSSGGELGAVMTPLIGTIVIGPLANVDVYTGFTGPTSFGSGNVTNASSFSGDHVAMFASFDSLSLPQGYLSGMALSSSATWNGATFASLGVTPGTYVWSWGTAANQNFTLIIGQATVPDSGSSIALLFLSLGALFGASRFRSLRVS